MTDDQPTDDIVLPRDIEWLVEHDPDYHTPPSRALPPAGLDLVVGGPMTDDQPTDDIVLPDDEPDADEEGGPDVDTDPVEDAG